MKTFFNLFISLVLIFGSIFLYGAFKETELVEENLPVNIDNEIIEEIGFEEYILGNWQSTEDSKNLFVLEEEGVVKNVYNDELMNSGTWNIDGYKLKTIVEEEEFVYTVIFAGLERLELSYLPRGNTLHFVRVTE